MQSIKRTRLLLPQQMHSQAICVQACSGDFMTANMADFDRLIPMKTDRSMSRGQSGNYHILAYKGAHILMCAEYAV